MRNACEALVANCDTDADFVVKQKEGMLMCSECQVVRYCSQDHQRRHRCRHKKLCAEITNLRARVEKEDKEIRDASPNAITPAANAFKNHIGYFGTFLTTWSCRAVRFELAQYCRIVGLDGLSEALDHMQDIIRLCSLKFDQCKVRYIIPRIMLR